jgi:hypothetical protein
VWESESVVVADEHWNPRCTIPDDLVAPVRVEPKGGRGPTKAQASGPRYRQTSSGLYVPSEVDEGIVEQRIFEQGHRIRSYGAVTGWAALRWHGVRYCDGRSAHAEGVQPVPLVVGRHPLQPDPRVTIRNAQIAPTERVLRRGIWCTTPQRALFDELRFMGSLREAVVILDMAAAARVISVKLFAVYVMLRPAWTGVRFVRRVLLLASDHSRSPQESRMRLVWVLDAGLGPPLCNVPVFDRHGRLLGYPDLFDPVAGVVGEYDGADHKARDRRRADITREQLFRDHGLEYFTVVEGDLLDRGAVVRRMHAARARAQFLPGDRTLWTLTPPTGWSPRAEPLDVHLVRTGEAPWLVRA